MRACHLAFERPRIPLWAFSKNKMILTIVSWIFIILAVLFTIFIFLPWGYGAPFEPTHSKGLKNIIELAKPRKGDKIVDLGSGDGRIVVEFAKNPLIKEAHGYEINPILVFLSRRKIKKLGLQKKAFIHRKSFWKVNLKKFDIIVAFQIIFVMKNLKEKIEKEIKGKKRKTKIISNNWKFPEWKYIKKKGLVYLYKK